MKKMFIAAALVIAGLVMTACNGEGCYKLMTKTTIMGVTATADIYVYGNGDDCDAAIANAKSAAEALGGKFSCTKAKVAYNEEDCIAQNTK